MTRRTQWRVAWYRVLELTVIIPNNLQTVAPVDIREDQQHPVHQPTAEERKRGS